MWEGNVDLINLIFYELVLCEILRKNTPNVLFIIRTINNTKNIKKHIKY